MPDEGMEELARMLIEKMKEPPEMDHRRPSVLGMIMGSCHEDMKPFAMEELYKWDDEIRFLRREVHRLSRQMRCAFCGEVLTTSSLENVDAILGKMAEHIVQCDRHPVRRVSIENEILREMIAAMGGIDVVKYWAMSELEQLASLYKITEDPENLEVLPGDPIQKPSPSPQDGQGDTNKDDEDEAIYLPPAT